MIKLYVMTRLYCARDSGVSNSAPKGCMRRATRRSARAVSSNPGPAARREKSWSRRGADPSPDQRKIFHPGGVVRGLDLDVPERGGRRTMNMGVGIS